MQVTLGKPVHSGDEGNPLEERQAVTLVHGNKLSTYLKPFEVTTILSNHRITIL